jgi:hypothetical protein
LSKLFDDEAATKDEVKDLSPDQLCARNIAACSFGAIVSDCTAPQLTCVTAAPSGSWIRGGGKIRLGGRTFGKSNFCASAAGRTVPALPERGRSTIHRKIVVAQS